MAKKESSNLIMKGSVVFILLTVLSSVCYCQKCDLTSTVKDDVYFPNLFKKAPIQYQMEVEYTMITMKQSNYYTEYYDVFEKKGRVDIIEGGKKIKYYYDSNGLEAFVVNGSTCREYNATATAEFMSAGVYNWEYKNITGNKLDRLVRGPSAMFINAYVMDQRDHSKVRYMGPSPRDIRGIPANIWRSCITETLTADFYFSADGYEDMYGLKDLKEIPLRVVVSGTDNTLGQDWQKIFPQNYEIMSFAPFLEDPHYALELPDGLGCGRKKQAGDIDIPNFQDNNLFVMCEAVYTNYKGDKEQTYTSTFMYAYDITSSHIAYFYTPWKDNNGKLEAGAPQFAVYDMKNKYLYSRDYEKDTCTISNSQRYDSKFVIPGGKGYISLTDPTFLFPNNEFTYLSTTNERGYDVNVFERVFREGSPLRDDEIKSAVVSHYYLKDSNIKQGYTPVEEALARIRIGFNRSGDENEVNAGVLNFNFFIFSTQIERRNRVFDITSCFRNDDDIMYITISFPADQTTLSKIRPFFQSIRMNMADLIYTETEITPARLPNILVDTRGGLLITLYILQRPPENLDFDAPKEGVSIVNPKEMGLASLDECANNCLENDDGCWSFAYCGATCYIGVDGVGTTETKKDCAFYNRTNYNIIPRMETLQSSLEEAVKESRIKLVVPVEGEGITLTADYVGPAVFGESEEIFRRLGFERNFRLRVKKTASKLVQNDANVLQKNFGRLTYGQCQSLCLDYAPCETMSYCVSNSECILSKAYGDEIKNEEIIPDNFCTLLARKYSDKFIRSPGITLSQSAVKKIQLKTEEECAGACEKEKSFKCLSFDYCPRSKEDSCRLHAAHFIDLKNNEGALKKDTVCGHYSKKFSYDFDRKKNANTLGNSIRVSTNISLEECAKICIEYGQGVCNGFDFCQERKLTMSSCSVVTTRTSDMKTAYSPICTHYTRDIPVEVQNTYSNATAGGVGFLVFVIAGFLGGLIVYGIAYCRVNKSR